MVELFIWKYGLYILIIWTLLESSCSTKEGGLPYQPPEFTPIYREECYSDHKNILCQDKTKETKYIMPLLQYIFLQEIK
jgi:hypothetical protein